MAKETFASKTFASQTFASGNWVGVGVDVTAPTDGSLEYVASGDLLHYRTSTEPAHYVARGETLQYRVPE